jgi:hypothetical protein
MLILSRGPETLSSKRLVVDRILADRSQTPWLRGRHVVRLGWIGERIKDRAPWRIVLAAR